jgi:FkbM family methyltransferase
VRVDTVTIASVVNRVLGLFGIRVVRANSFDRLIGNRYGGRIYGHKVYFNPEDAGYNLSGLVGADLSRAGGEIAYLRDTLRPGQVVVDVGANIGLLTLIAAHQVGPQGRVFAFEPGPLSFALLSANIAANGYHNVTIDNAAVSDRDGTVDLYVCATGESDNRISGTIDDGSGRERISVRSVALDDYFQDRAIDFIKIDAQGAEPLILKGLSRIMAESVNLQIMMEYCPEAFSSLEAPAAFLSRIQASGYEMLELREKGPEPVDADYLLSAIAGPGQPSITNLVLRKRN